ncbi:MAG: SDR family oxidoreductase [Deltaproteobacteria bacterium]|nr:SDR family oxidoreductase [Deltaproteobacteria bacterium]MBW1915021.1 SDR family oxidoreductase [Deltaproteobacteria bacterium]
MYDLTDKIVLVTGAGGKRGLGRAIAKRLAMDRADIVVVDKHAVLPQDESEGWSGINSVVDEIQGIGRQALGLTCDITNSQQVNQMVNEAIAKFSRIDILVNNAGIHINRNIEEFSDEIWMSQLDVNLNGTFFCARAVARNMINRGQGGRIINIGSFRSKAGAVGETAYCASKFGVVGLTQCLALELASHNILVNAVCPALTDTDINLDMFDNISSRDDISAQEARNRVNEHVAAEIPLGRLGTPRDVANLVAFLASDEADFITGQSINVNGGLFTAI